MSNPEESLIKAQQSYEKKQAEEFKKWKKEKEKEKEKIDNLFNDYLDFGIK